MDHIKVAFDLTADEVTVLESILRAVALAARDALADPGRPGTERDLVARWERVATKAFYLLLVAEQLVIAEVILPNGRTRSGDAPGVES